MLDKRRKSITKDIKRWEKILGPPVCLGEWNCLTKDYRYPNGEERFRACKFIEVCREIMRRAEKCETSR